MKKIIIGAVALICVQSLKAQDDKSESTSYNPHQLFTQNFNPPPGTETRSVKGVPGHAYWQNSASYLIHATLSEKDTSVTGDVTISYTNNSPDELDYLWLQAEQNLFNPSSRSAATALYPGDNYSIPGGGYQIKDVTVTYGGKSYTVKPIITDTRMQVRLNSPLHAKGDNISIKINYSFLIPLDGAGRFGRQYTKNGVVYQIGQWYPRMCVYDDQQGWDILPYMNMVSIAYV